MKNKGFTLIELLIVITLLGILAVAVLSAINPIEQMNRSRDTATRSDAEQLINAIDRYYATVGYYPWMANAASENTNLDWTEITTADQAFGIDGQRVLELLSAGASAELKESYITRIISGSANPLHIYNMGEQGNSTYVCFNPASAAMGLEAYKRCSAHADYGALPADFPAEACPDPCTTAGSEDNPPDTCFSCLP